MTLTRVEPAPYRVRAWKDGRVIVDSRRAKIGFGPRPPNFWLFPKEDVTAPAEAIEAEHDGLVAVKWSAADEWWEEDERVWGEHPRDPRHRVDVRQSSRHIVVSWQGTVIAESRRPVLLFETDLPLRFYLPRADVRFELLRRSALTTWCPYKGLAATTTSRSVKPAGQERCGATRHRSSTRRPASSASSASGTRS